MFSDPRTLEPCHFTRLSLPHHCEPFDPSRSSSSSSSSPAELPPLSPPFYLIAILGIASILSCRPLHEFTYIDNSLLLPQRLFRCSDSSTPATLSHGVELIPTTSKCLLELRLPPWILHQRRWLIISGSPASIPSPTTIYPKCL